MTWHRVPMELDGERPAPVSIAGVALLLVPAGAHWYAIADRCSHAGCAFSEDGEIDGHVVICNCHGSEFDIRTGEVLAPPAREPIAVFPVRHTDRGLEIEL